MTSALAMRSAADFLPTICTTDGDLSCLAEAAQACRGCDIYKRATQAVFGEGDPEADVMLVGEQPGNDEDLEGHPFVGPAGRELDGFLEEAGLNRDGVWLTNAVKHFKWVARGEKRIHDKPTMLEIRACKPWLDAEIEIVQPKMIVLLGATAAQSLLGREFRITKHRGEVQELPEGLAVATWHPSAVLRAPEREDRHRMRREIVSDIERGMKAAGVRVR